MPRIDDAMVGGRLATFSISAGRASAEEIAQQVDAIGVVQTRLQLAEINVLFAPLSGPACPANQIEINKEKDQNGQIQVPGGQVHLKLLTSSVQAPPLRQGETGAHSLILFSQRAPVNPGRHWHWKLSSESLQVPPCWCC